MTHWTRLSALALTLTGGTALAIGGPLADPQAPPSEVQEFEEETQTNEPVSPDLQGEEEWQTGDVEELEPIDEYDTTEGVDTDPMDPYDTSEPYGDPEELEFNEEVDTFETNEPAWDDEGAMINEGSTDERYVQEGDVEELDTEEVTILRRDADTGVETGPYVLLGGGVDGFTGGLGNELRLGPTWGATAGVTGKRLGFELGYSGSANNLDAGTGGAGRGADVVRNGGQAALKLNITETALHPYVLGGIGIERYTIRNGENLGFQDDTSGYVPAAAGLRWNIGRSFTADARVSYNFMFDDDFSPDDAGGNRLQGMVTLGGTY